MRKSSRLQNLFRERLAYYLKKYEWTQNDLAEVMGITQPAISQMLTGDRSPRLDTLEAVANALEIKPFELIREK